jgi:hypothetical protein
MRISFFIAAVLGLTSSVQTDLVLGSPCVHMANRKNTTIRMEKSK